MSAVLEELLRDVPGFGWCFAKNCRFVDSGSPMICYTCASRSMQPLAARRCQVCDRPLASGQRCWNSLCNGQRWFTRNHAIAPDKGSLANAIRAKYDSTRAEGFSILLARILLGYLDRNASRFREVDLIVSSPAYVAEGGHDHIRRIMNASERRSPGTWPFDLADPPALVKTAATEKLAGKGVGARREAKADLVAAMHVPNPFRTRGLRIAVLDDLFTTGTTLDAAARVLRLAGGAAEVMGISLARRMGQDDDAVAAGAASDTLPAAAEPGGTR